MTATLTDLQISVKSLQYVRVPVFEVTGADPTGDAVSMAFPISGVDPTTYYGGNWQTLDEVYYARCLVGPAGSVALPIGYYDVYVKVTDSPETPVLYAGTLEVF